MTYSHTEGDESMNHRLSSQPGRLRISLTAHTQPFTAYAVAAFGPTKRIPRTICSDSEKRLETENACVGARI